METIANLANTASKAVWGESETNKEPISGAKGDTTHGEPYDAGNLDENSQKKVESSLTGKPELDPTSTSHYDESSRTSNLGEQSHKSTPGENPESLTFGSKSGSHGENLGENYSRSNVGENTSSIGGGGTTASKPAPGDTSAGQNDTRDPSDPSTGASHKQDVDTNTPGLSREGGELSGDGPRPLESVSHKDDRSLGQEKPQGEFSSSSGSSQPGSNPTSGVKLPEGKSTEEGTGEKVVPATGFAADGGDFDATKPGAGREADRLLETKGVFTGGNNLDTSSSSSHGHHDKTSHSPHGHTEKEKSDKPSLGQRIKDKLHKH